MTVSKRPNLGELQVKLAEAEATIGALLAGQIDAVIDPASNSPVLLSKAQAALRESEESLRKSEEQYRQIVEATSDGILKLDKDAKIVFVNGRFAAMLGYSSSEMIGVEMSAFKSPVANSTFQSTLVRRKRGISDAVDSTFRHKDGTDVAVNIAGSPLFDAQQNYIGSLAMVRDVTEQKKLQAQLMVSDRMASVGTLAAGVAHEINNPLSTVIGNLDYVADSLKHLFDSEPASASTELAGIRYLKDIKEPLDDAREGADRVRLIVRDLKIFSRSPKDEPSGPVNVNAVMDSSLRMAWNEIRHRAKLVKDYGVVPGVAGSDARLGQVFLNLIVNAAQSLQDGRAEHNEIRVATRFDGERVIVEVSDTGAGIPPGVIGRIFDVFFTTKELGSGMGLGLAICYRIVSDMGGELTVESKVDKGTTFRLALPTSGATEMETPALVEESYPSPRRGRILVVDDEASVGDAVKRILGKQHEILAIVSAQAALDLCQSGQEFDLILCDMMMPNVTGVDLYRELSVVAPEQARRMLFMTGGAFSEQARRFLSDPKKDHIEKPFDPADLRAAIHGFLRT